MLQNMLLIGSMDEEKEDVGEDVSFPRIQNIEELLKKFAVLGVLAATKGYGEMSGFANRLKQIGDGLKGPNVEEEDEDADEEEVSSQRIQNVEERLKQLAAIGLIAAKKEYEEVSGFDNRLKQMEDGFKRLAGLTNGLFTKLNESIQRRLAGKSLFAINE